MENKFAKYQKYVPFILRIGLGLVFFVFGIDKFFRPDYWIGWMPNWIMNLIPFGVNQFIYFQGALEAIIGLFLIIGLFTRISALISAFITGAIVLTLIFNQTSINHFVNFHIDKDIFIFVLNDIVLRDLGLLAIGISLVLLGPGEILSLENKIKKWKKRK